MPHDRRAHVRPQAVLFACARNIVRSPMAAALFSHLFGRGIYVALGRRARRASPTRSPSRCWTRSASTSRKHKPMTFEELEDWEGLNFDLIITLAPGGAPQGARTDAHARRRRRILADARPDRPSRARATQRLDAYRDVRDMLMRRIKERFEWHGGSGNE